MPDYASARLNMLESQLRPNQIDDPDLLAALGDLPRERFLQERMRGVAYADEDIPLDGTHFLMEPLVLARLAALAAPAKTDKALVIGCATGYAAAVLGRLCHNVIGLESDANLAAEAKTVLRDIGSRNVLVVEGGLAQGYGARAPYDVIFFGGAVEIVPPAITDQLAEGGRLAAVLRAPGGIGRVSRIERRGGRLSTLTGHDAATLPLPGFARPKEFVF